MIDASSKSNPLRDVASRPPESGDIIAGKYRVENVVGTGGMGIVVAARHLQLGQQVAIKLLRLSELEPERQAEARARFLREGQAAAALSSDHVVRIHDVGTLDSGEPFMVMELLRGDDLAKIIEEKGPAPASVAVDYILQACHAVAEAHALGIVHRDLKPSNLFVSVRADGRVTLKVLDFGISKAVAGSHGNFDGNLTETRSVVGSPYYMSPEQVRDSKRVDARSDIWSLGTILYELLAAEPPFNASTFPGICAAIAADHPRSLRESHPEIAEELDAIVARCLEKNPEKRFQTVGELVTKLTPFAPLPHSAASAAYASRRDVMLLSEPFELKVDRHAATVHGQSTNVEPPVASRASGTQPSLPDTKQSRAVEQSGARRQGALGKSSTLVSSDTRLGHDGTLVTGATPPSAAASSGPRAVHIAAMVVVALAAAAGTWVVAGHKAGTPPAAAIPAAPMLAIESTPSGATVLDGDRVLGVTPCSVPIARDPLQTAARRLTLRLDGYESYEVQPPSTDHDARISAVLKAIEKPAAPPAPPPAAVASSPAPAEPATTSVAKARPRAVRPSAPAAPKPSAPSDIRLER